MSSYQFYDETPQIIVNKQAHKKKEVHNPAGTKEFRKLNEDDIPILDKITVKECQELQSMRNQAKLTREELAKKLNYPESIVKALEIGKPPYNIGQYRKIYRFLKEYLKKMEDIKESDVGKNIDKK